MTGEVPLLRVDGLTVELPTRAGVLRLVDDVSFDVQAGELVGLAGESGSGKTMTGLAIMGLLPFARGRTSGRVELEGRDLLALPPRALRRVRGREIAMVFQEPMSSLYPASRVGDQVVAVLRTHQDLSPKDASLQAVSMLERVGISDPAQRARQYPHELSGGMQQRVALAIALACRPKLLIADEPTTALDVTIQAQIVELLRSLQADLGMAVLFVTHDLALLARLCQRVMVMYAGQVVEDAPAWDLLHDPLQPYSQALVSALPRPEHRGGELPTIEGSPPQAGELPTGCRFHPRCPVAMPVCSSTEPAMAENEAGRRARCLRVSFAPYDEGRAAS